MKRLPNIRLLALTAAVMLAAGGTRLADAQQPNVQPQQPNADATRGVARISLMDGEVSVRRGDAGEWVAGVINAPLLAGDSISTAPNSRAEVQFDAANMLRIGGNAEIHLATLEYGRYQVELAHGTVTFVVLRPSSANIEVDTPNVSVRPSKLGAYRITVNEAGESQITARAGDVEVFTPRGSQWVSAGQSMMARGTAADPEFQIVNAGPIDDWDRWNQMRDRALVQSPSDQHVPQGVYGAEDLDPYGSWVDVAPYGYVWRPTVGVGWAPYRQGRWVWEDWYGWTWVSYDPWGWAPYHYGRWFMDAGFGWCWYPGMFGPRHYWSPALVAFFGYGPGVGFGFGFGNIGWVPLAPYELFRPWWGPGFYGRGFNQGFGFTNVNISAAYRNARFNGISGINAGDFRNGRFGAISRVSGEQVRTAGLVRGQVPMAPSAANLQFGNRAAGFTPRSSGNTRFFSHQQPAAAQRVPFAEQQRAFQQSAGSAMANRGGMNAAAGASRGAAGRSMESGRAGTQATPQVAQGSRSAQSGQTAGSGGWRRFGEPSGESGGPATGSSGGWRRTGSSPASQSARPATGAGGWERFGQPRGTGSQAPAVPRSGYQGGSGYNAPRYNAPSPAPQRSGGGYSAPRSAPSYSAPSRPSGGGGYSAPAARSGGGGGGGGSHSGGGGHSRR